MARAQGDLTRRGAAKGLRYNAWQAMRVLRRFTLADLVANLGCKRSNVDKYVRGLRDAGFLRVAGTTPGQSGWLIYQLVLNPGPLPPRLRVDGTVYDPNRGAVYSP